VIKYMILAIIIVGVILFALSLDIKTKQILVLEEIAFNLDELRISVDNIVYLKDEIMTDLSEHLPNWAWEE